MSRHYALAFVLWAAPAAAVEPGGARGWFKPVTDLPSDFREEVRPGGLVTLGLAGAATLIVRPDDGRVKRAVLSARPYGKTLSDAANLAGNGAVLFPLTAAAFVGGKLASSEAARSFGEQGLEALAVSGLETLAFKYAVRRERPDGSDRHSFPSGHSSAAFSVATVAAEQWGWAAGVPAYLGAAFVGLGRLERNKHFLSDVVFGAGLGIAAGRAVAMAHAPERKASSARLILTPGGAALALAF